ncbi:MAG: PAS domain S-box protein, partial [Proteobacteria bacterium]|nr:PAS domain S-box protein [Pseudomonadota bacterium]
GVARRAPVLRSSLLRRMESGVGFGAVPLGFATAAPCRSAGSYTYFIRAGTRPWDRRVKVKSLLDILSPYMIKVKGISLKWKLLIPFLLLAFIGTTVLTFIGLSSQQNLIKEEERKGLLQYYDRFLEELDHKKKQAASLAAMIAENPQVQALLAERNREGLIDLLLHTYVQLKMNFNIEQFHFHLPVAVSFLRLHYLERYGDEMIAFRKTIRDAIAKREPVSGLELGATGFGIRGVAPVFRYGEVVGSIEIGHSFNEDLLIDINRRWGIDLALYRFEDKKNYWPMARTGKGPRRELIDRYLPGEGPEKAFMLIAPKEHPDRAILIGPVKDYAGKTVALVEISVDRSEIHERLTRTRNLMFLVGALGMGISFLLTFLVTQFFTRPIMEIVREAQDIAQEKREVHLEPGPNDEIGSLTRALNVMLDALKERRMEIERHARTLEKRVEERTADLVASEEKYRTLVENVPLLVYRILPDGTTEFINSYLTESLGYSIEEAVGDRNFWREKIAGDSSDHREEPWGECFENGHERRTERVIKDKGGRTLTFIDHAIPAADASGRVKWVDGIMLDISALKRLQERALRAEEIRLLGEISAHMAHEIRNPLITAGGFARRLRDALPEGDANRKLAQIIVEEVARLENYLKNLISSIRPFELSLTEVDVNHVLASWLERLDGHLKSKGIEVVREMDPHAKKIQGDEERLDQAFESLLKHAIISMPQDEMLFLSTAQTGDRLVVTLKHKVHRLSEDDLDKFFFPHVEDGTEWTVLDLPFSKIVIHRHGGQVDLSRDEENLLTMRIEFPVKSRTEKGG